MEQMVKDIYTRYVFFGLPMTLLELLKQKREVNTCILGKIIIHYILRVILLICILS